MIRRLLCTACVLTLVSAFAVAPASATTSLTAEATPADTTETATAPGDVSSATMESPSPSAKPLPEPSAEGDISALAVDDTLPGVAIQWHDAWKVAIEGDVTNPGDVYDYYSIYLETGTKVEFYLNGPDSPLVDFDLYLYDPSGVKRAEATGTSADEVLSYTVTTQGTWSLGVEAHAGLGHYYLYAVFRSLNDGSPGIYGAAVPAEPLTPSPVWTWLDAYSDWDDVYQIWLNTGDLLSLSLKGGSAFTTGFKPNLYLYGPGTADVSLESPIAKDEGAYLPKNVTYRATQPGYYYVDVYEYAATHEQGEAVLSWSIVSPSSPVYRFYNFTNNTHFFTDSLDEANSVILQYSNVFNFEGVAYSTNPYRNTQPLYRFYNRVSKSHFYTASIDEANSILLKWSNVYTLDGQTYAVCPAPVSNSIPVYRFYNLRNGSHFYTASATERDTVMTNWSNVYNYEGEAFWLAQ